MNELQLFNPEKYNRQSIRFPGHDYSWPGYYFITICIKDRGCYLGEIRNGIMGLSEIGVIVQNEWYKTISIRKNVHLDEFVIMPNHIHFIIQIIEPRDRAITAYNDQNADDNRCTVVQRRMAVQRHVGVQRVEPLRDEPLHDEPPRNEPPHGESTQFGSAFIEFPPNKMPDWRINKFQHIVPGSVGTIVRGIKQSVTQWCNQKGHEYFRWQRNYYDSIIETEDGLENVRNYIKNNPKNWNTDRNNPNFIT